MKIYTYILLFFLACLSTVGCKSNDEQLREYVEQEKRTGGYPVEAGDGLWLDSVSTSPGLNLYFHYMLSSAHADELSSENMAATKLGFKLNVLSLIITDNADIKRFRNAGVIFHFIFRDIDGSTVMDVTVTPDEYREAMKSR